MSRAADDLERCLNLAARRLARRALGLDPRLPGDPPRKEPT